MFRAGFAWVLVAALTLLVGRLNAQSSTWGEMIDGRAGQALPSRGGEARAAAGINVPLANFPEVGYGPKAETIDFNNSAGVFIGINQFAPNAATGTSAFAPLAYCVDDAIDLAHEFVRLGLIKPENVRLGLSGGPVKPETVYRLRELRALRVPEPFLPGKNAILGQLQWLTGVRGARQGGIAFFTISTHGYFKESDSIVCYDTVNDLVEVEQPSTGAKLWISQGGLLPKSALTHAEITSLLNSSKASTRIVIIDACRENLVPEGIRGGSVVSSPLSSSVLEGITLVKGTAVFLSTKVGGFGVDGGYDFKDRSLKIQNGLFTYYFLEGLKGAAEPSPDGLVRLEDLREFVDAQVTSWIEMYKPGWEVSGIEVPTDPDTLQVPLAVNSTQLTAFKRWTEETADVAEKYSRFVEDMQYSPDVADFTDQLRDEVLSGIDWLSKQPPRRQDDLLDQIEKVCTKTLTYDDFKTWWTNEGRNHYGLPEPTRGPLAHITPTQVEGNADPSQSDLPSIDRGRTENTNDVAPRAGLPGIRITKRPGESISR